jgi:hypothetical protein
MEPDDERLESAKLARSRAGRKAQVGGGIAVFLGVLLLFALPPVEPGSPVNLHSMADLFIGIGVGLIAVGTLARIFLLPPE